MIQDLIRKIENRLPMTFGNLLLFIFILYLLFIVGNSVVKNHKFNQDIEKERSALYDLESEIVALENEINYLKTDSFREKEAREKLGFKLEDEKMMPLPIDTIEERIADSGLVPKEIKTLNYRLWWEYFFKR